MQRGNLAEQVLKEVPEQVCSYMERVGFKPIAIEQAMEPVMSTETAAA